MISKTPKQRLYFFAIGMITHNIKLFYISFQVKRSFIYSGNNLNGNLFQNELEFYVMIDDNIFICISDLIHAEIKKIYHWKNSEY